MSLLLVRREIHQRASEHRLVQCERRLPGEYVAPRKVIFILLRISGKVMVHLIRLHNMAISTPPYLKLLLTSHLVVLDAVQELWVLDEVRMEFLYVID